MGIVLLFYNEVDARPAAIIRVLRGHIFLEQADQVAAFCSGDDADFAVFSIKHVYRPIFLSAQIAPIETKKSSTNFFWLFISCYLFKQHEFATIFTMSFEHVDIQVNIQVVTLFASCANPNPDKIIFR